MTLLYLMEGSGSLHLDDRSFDLQDGDFYLIPSGVYYAIETSLESICIFLNLRTSFIAAEYRSVFMEDPMLTGFLTQSLAAEQGMTWLALHTKENEAVRDLVLTLFAEYINQDKYCNHTMKHYLSLLFAAILRDGRTTVDSPAKTTRRDRQFQQIAAWLKQNYPTASLSALAEQIHFSKQYICRIVRKKTGGTFQALLLEIRLDMARQYLTDTALTLEEISCLCGFASSSHLSRVFRNRFGMPPSVYRKENGR